MRSVNGDSNVFALAPPRKMTTMRLQNLTLKLGRCITLLEAAVVRAGLADAPPEPSSPLCPFGALSPARKAS